MINKLIHKSKGNITSLLLGIMFLTLVLTYCLFTFKATMLDTVVDFLDDAISSSLLAAALVNDTEYGRSNQLVIYDEADMITATAPSGYNNLRSDWYDYETAIQLSEYNFGSSLLVEPDSLPEKMVLYENANTGRHTASWETDATKRRSITDFIVALNSNLTNGNDSLSTIDFNNSLSDITGSLTPDLMTVHKNMLDKFILGTYIVNSADGADDAMKITRFDEYDIYRAELCDRKMYKSDFFDLSVVGTDSTFPTIKVSFHTLSPYDTGISNSTTDYEISDFKNFNKVYKPIEGTTEHYYTKLSEYRLLRKRFLNDIGNSDDSSDPSQGNCYYGSPYGYGYLNNALSELGISKSDLESGVIVNNKENLHYPLFCYINTHTTFLNKYNTERVKYPFFFSKANGSDSATTDYEGDDYTVDATYRGRMLNVGDRSPIVAYSKYSYTSSDSEYSYTDDKSYHYYGMETTLDVDGKPLYNAIENTATLGADTDETGRHIYYVKLNDGKMRNSKLYNTSLYTEITFNMRTFITLPENSRSMSYFEAEPMRVTMARLVDIQLNE